MNIYNYNINNMSSTLITALYDIGREKLIGIDAHRPFSKYLNWFRHLLTINVPMVIFIPDYLQDYVIKYRPNNYQTKVIIRKFEDLHAYKYYDRIQATIDNMQREVGDRKPMHYVNCPEFMTARYETVLFSKIDFLKEVAEENPFSSEYFIWLDAGTFYDKPPFDVTLPWPDPYKIKILSTGKFLIADISSFNYRDKSILNNKKEYIKSHQNNICAYILGGNKSAVLSIHKLFWDEVESLLKLNIISNDQQVLQLIIIDDPDKYYIYYCTDKYHHDRPRPLNNRMIPYELSLGTKIYENYAKNTNLKLLTVATREIKDDHFIKWKKSAEHYGYDYEILSRTEKWNGFGTKIISYHNALTKLTTPYVVMTDCVDLFFTGSSYELLDKFLALNVDLIVGAEMQIAYPNGRHDSNLIQKFFEQIAEGPQMFPNSGFLMGKTSEMLKLMELNLGQIDDQAACFDAIYEGKMPLHIDYKTELIGNVPNYHRDNHLAIDYYQFDPKLQRYKSKLHNTYPPVFHFPGGNWEPMEKFYLDINPELSDINTVNNGPTVFIFVIIIILIIFLLLMFHYHNISILKL